METWTRRAAAIALAVAFACGRHEDPPKAPGGGSPAPSTTPGGGGGGTGAPSTDTPAPAGGGGGGGSPDAAPPPSGPPACGPWRGVFQVGPGMATAIALGPGCGVTVAGSTSGTIGAQAFGRSDPFLAQVDAGRSVQIVQFGSSSDEGAADVAIDAAGNRWVAWSVVARLGGGTGLASRFAPDGTETLAYRVPFASRSDAIAVDPEGSAYLAGARFTKNGAPSDVFAYDTDVFVVKIDGATGAEAWTTRFGTDAADAPSGMATAADGSLVVAGSTGGALAGNRSAGGTDGFVARIAKDGTLGRVVQLGGPGDDSIDALAVDGAGSTYVLGSGGLDASSAVPRPGRFLARLDGALAPAWSRDVGLATAVAAGPGGAWIAGYTPGALPGQASSGGSDAFVARYDAAGNRLWARQFGSAQDDLALAIAVDAQGNAYATGWTRGSLGASSTGDVAVFVAKLDPDGNLQ